MKRLKTLVLLLVFVCLLFTACSDASAKITITAGNVTAAAGETVQIPVTINEGSNISAADVIITYDVDKLSYAGYKDSDTFDPNIKTGNLEQDGRFHYALATLTPYTEAGTLFTLELKIADGVTGEIPLKVEVPTLVDTEQAELKVKTVDGTITVE